MRITAPRRIAAALGAGLAGTALLLGPGVASAAGSTTVSTTDKAGDARIALKKVPTADLLGAGARFSTDTVTFYVDLTTAPTAAALATGNYTFYTNIAGASVAFGTDAVLSASSSDPANAEESPACLAYFGAAGPGSTGPIAVNSAAGELSATFSRTDVNAAASCYGEGATTVGATQQVSASSEYRDPPRGLAGGGIARDTAAAGPLVTIAN